MIAKEKVLSIIVPIHNASAFLRRCIDSVISQIDERAEVILVNDGSTDDSGTICDEYRKNSSLIKVIHQQNAGGGAARNCGLVHSTGIWLTFLDADDFLDDKFYETVRKHFDNKNDLLLFDFVTEDGNSGNSSSLIKPFKNEICYQEKDRDMFIKKCFFSGEPTNDSNVNMRSVWGKLFRSAFLRDNGIYFDTGVRIGADMLYMLKVYSHYQTAKYVPSVIYHYYFYNAMSITNQYKPDLDCIIKAYDNAIRPWLKLHPEYDIYYAWYRLNDIILFLKYCTFHPNNQADEMTKRKKLKNNVHNGQYVSLYAKAKTSGLIKKYSFGKRFVFWLYINGFYFPLKWICKIKYK